MWLSLLYVCLCTACLPGANRSEDSPEAGVKDGCELEPGSSIRAGCALNSCPAPLVNIDSYSRTLQSNGRFTLTLGFLAQLVLVSLNHHSLDGT